MPDHTNEAPKNRPDILERFYEELSRIDINGRFPLGVLWQIAATNCQECQAKGMRFELCRKHSDICRRLANKIEEFSKPNRESLTTVIVDPFNCPNCGEEFVVNVKGIRQNSGKKTALKLYETQDTAIDIIPEGTKAQDPSLCNETRSTRTKPPVDIELPKSPKKNTRNVGKIDRADC